MGVLREAKRNFSGLGRLLADHPSCAPVANLVGVEPHVPIRILESNSETFQPSAQGRLLDRFATQKSTEPLPLYREQRNTMSGVQLPLRSSPPSSMPSSPML